MVRETVSESSAVHEKLAQMSSAGKFNKKYLNDGRIGLVPKENSDAEPEYFLEKLDAMVGQAKVDKILAFLKKYFESQGDVILDGEQPVEEIKSFLERSTADELLNIIYIVTDKKGDVCAYLSGSYVPNVDEEGRHTGDGSVIIGYILSSDDVEHHKIRKRGYALELSIAFYEEALERAETRGETIANFCGETVPEVEALANQNQINRVYYRSEDGVFHEVPDYIPPLFFNKDTGEPAVPNYKPQIFHFMIDVLQSDREIIEEDIEVRTAPKEELMKAVRATSKAFYEKSRSDFNNEQAYQRSLAIVEEYPRPFEESLKGSSRIYLLTKQQREELQRRGVKFEENQP